VFVVAAAAVVFLLVYSVSVATAAARVVGEMTVQFYFFLKWIQKKQAIISLC
jgi:hypothetical protein